MYFMNFITFLQVFSLLLLFGFSSHLWIEISATTLLASLVAAIDVNSGAQIILY